MSDITTLATSERSSRLRRRESGIDLPGDHSTVQATSSNLSRWFDSTVGKWLSEDPLGLGPDVNPYRYCRNASSNSADPTGQEPIESVGAGVAAGAITVLASHWTPTFPPEGRVLTPTEQEIVLYKAKIALDALVASHRISADEEYMRMQLISASLKHQMGFSASATPNPAYYKEIGGEWVLRDGEVASGLRDRVFNKTPHVPPYNETGCRRASQSLMLYAMARLSEKLGTAEVKAFDKAVAGKPFDELMPKYKSSDFQDYTPNPDRSSFIPGDRVRMDNHMFGKPGQISLKGGEGSNVIYLGKDSAGNQLFLHMDRAMVETFEGLRETVQGYSVPGDPLIENYKFTERYAPRMPASVRK